MNTLCLFERLLALMIPIASLSATLAVVCLATPGNAFATGTASIGLSTVAAIPTTVVLNQAVDDYQPPDNGGPGRTGGSGTR